MKKVQNLKEIEKIYNDVFPEDEYPEENQRVEQWIKKLEQTK